MTEWHFREAVTFVFCCLSFLSEVDVNAVSHCVHRVGLLERLLIPSALDRYINATSFISPYLPSEARVSGIGWCSDDVTCNTNEERQFIEVDFGAEVMIEAVTILKAGGGYVTHYHVEYAGSDKTYHCISDRSSSETVFNKNRTCSLIIEPSNFTNSVIARFIRIIPIQWVGASACLRMELYGCTIKECLTISNLIPNTITTPIVNQTLNLLNPWCASVPVLVPEQLQIILTFDEAVYLTQLQARSNSVSFSIFLHTSQTLYRNTVGFNTFGLFRNTRIIPLWPAINTTLLDLRLYSASIIFNPVCFAVELTGCLSSDVVDHSEGMETSSMSDDIMGECTLLPTPTSNYNPSITSNSQTELITMTATSSELTVTRNTDVDISHSTTSVFITVTTTYTVEITESPVASCPVVQQSKVSSDSNNNCNIIAVVVPTALVFIAIIVVVCINIVVVKRVIQKKRRKVEVDNVTSMKNHTGYVVENDLYQSQDVTDHENAYAYATKSQVTSQYSLVKEPDSPTVSGGDYLQEIDKAKNKSDSMRYDYPVVPPSVTAYITSEYEIVTDTTTAEGDDTYSVPAVPVTTTVNPSYVDRDTIAHNTDEQ